MSSTAEEISRSLGKKKTSIDATATFLVFEPGLYTAKFTASSSGPSDVGLRLPCARLEAVPVPGGGQLLVTMMPATGWMSAETSSAHVLVTGGRAGAVLTIYRSSDAVDMPVLEFRAVIKAGDLAQAAAPQPAYAPPAAPASVGLSLVAHFRDSGTASAANATWVRSKSDADAMEGFALAVTKGDSRVEVEYQGVMGKNWLTQWYPAGQYCGSRGLQLPLLGFRVRLKGEDAARYAVQYWGAFGGDDVVGPVDAAELCQLDQRPLSSIMVSVTELQTEAADTPATARRRPKAKGA